MFEEALTLTHRFPANTRDALLARLDRVRNISHKTETVSGTLSPPRG
jgi:hypothetical protein